MKENFAIDAINHIDYALVEEYVKEKEHLKRKRENKKRTPWIKWVSVAACFIFVVTSIISIIGILGSGDDNILPPPAELDSIIWCQPATEYDQPDISAEERLYVWKGKNVSKDLYSALQQAEDGEWLALCIGWTNSEDALNYVYKERTIGEWKAERDNVLHLGYSLLPELLKEGDYLKLGEKICTEGAPDGTKYAKSLYEERIAYYGKDLLAVYISDGEFDTAQVENDINVSIEKEKSIHKIIQDGRSEFLKEKSDACYAALKQKGYNVVFKNDYYFLFITKDEFSKLNSSQVSGYSFALASRKAFEQATIPVLDEPISKLALDKIYVWGGDYGKLSPKTNKELADTVNNLIKKWFYTYDHLVISIYKQKGSPAPELIGTDNYQIHAENSVFLSFDKYTITIPYEELDLDALGQIANDTSVIDLNIGIPTQPDVAG